MPVYQLLYIKTNAVHNIWMLIKWSLMLVLDCFIRNLQEKLGGINNVTHFYRLTEKFSSMLLAVAANAPFNSVLPQ